MFHFVRQAKANGVDIFRVFDGLNNIENLEIGIKAVLYAGGVAQGAILYTGDMFRPGTKYNLSYYLHLANKLVHAGAHFIAVKSMAGVLKPGAAFVLVRAIRTQHPEIPIHMHTHDAAGKLICLDVNQRMIVRNFPELWSFERRILSTKLTLSRHWSRYYARLCRSWCRYCRWSHR